MDRLQLSPRLSGSALKLIAIFSMVTDHCAYFLMEQGTPLYEAMRCFGRIAFPVFAFLIAEGFAHTRNRTRYFLTLCVFAIISELPWYQLNGNDGTHNVMFTLALGVVTLAIIDRLHYHKVLCISIVLAIALLAAYFGVDYGWRGILVIVFFHIIKDKTIKLLFALPLLMHYGIVGALLASITFSLYNGQRGFIKGSVAKYGFYAFYPVHLWVIVAIRLFL